MMLYWKYFHYHMIPKTIHYCWVGPKPKSKEILSCIKSWHEHNPDFVIKEWNESNFQIDAYPFTKKMYKERKWAFVADYIRLYALEQEGGIYLDADMFLLQGLAPLTQETCVLGEEAPGTISAGMVGAEAHHPYIIACKKFYDDNPEKLMTIPRILTQIYNETEAKESITVYPPKAFYPYDAEHIKEWHREGREDLGPLVYGVHLWNYSWGSPLNKFFKKLGIYSFGKKITEKLGIKHILKKLFGFI